MGQVHSVLLALLFHYLHPGSLYISSLSLSHAVSKQAVLSRSISGCDAVEEKNKIKNREGEKEGHLPEA